MAEVMKQMKGNELRSDMWDLGTPIQFAVSKKLHPKKDGIVVQTHKANVTLIESWLVQPMNGLQFRALALQATSQP